MSIPMPHAPRLGSGAPFGETLVRMLGDLLQRVRVELAETADHDLAVHEARKAMKRARALLRLARGAIGKKGFAAEDAVIRDAGRLLAPLRDARVTLDTIEAIASGSCPRLAERLEARHQILIEEDKCMLAQGLQMKSTIESATLSLSLSLSHTHTHTCALLPSVM